MGLNRSKYLAKYLRRKGYKTRYGGVGPCRVDPYPANPIKKEDVEWADIIIAARDKHKPILEKEWKVKGKEIITLEVSDSRKRAAETHPEFKKITHKKFNRVWTYPKLRKAVKEHLPLRIE
jgi:predicted protein tyrosine phosphatase